MKNEYQAGECLLHHVTDKIKGYKEVLAYLHCVGSPLTLYNGKLPEKHEHVFELLINNGYSLGHRNRLFCLDLDRHKTNNDGEYSISMAPNGAIEEFCLNWRGEEIGIATALDVDKIAGQPFSRAVYLLWIGINKDLRRQGHGQKFLNLICHYYAVRGIGKLFLDTTDKNLSAQSFYRKNGFDDLGMQYGFSISAS